MDYNAELAGRALAERRRILAVGPPVQDWPGPDLSYVRETDQSTYLANRLAVELWAAMVPEQAILHRLREKHGFDMAQGRTAKLVKRCLEVNPRTMRIHGFYGCIPGKHLAKHRPIDLSGKDNEGKGPGSKPKDNPRARQLGKLFAEHPKIEAAMVRLAITRKLHKDMAPFAVLTPAIVTASFYTLCREAGLEKEGKWPFSPELKKQGCEAIRRWYHKKKFDHPSRAALNELGDELGDTLSKDYRRIGINPIGLSLRLAYERVEMDEHYRDAMWVAMWPMRNGQHQIMRSSRLWGLAALECQCKLVLGTNMALGAKYDRADVMRLALNTLVPPPRPARLMLDDPEYVLLPEAKFPAEDPEFARNSFMTFAYDGDSSHLAEETLSAISEVFRCEIAAETIGDWSGRPNIEGWFRKLAAFDATTPAATGNSPDSPARRDPEQGAREITLYVPLAHESLDLIGRTHNITALDCLDGDTPLERLAELTRNGRVFRSQVGELGKGNLHLLLPRHAVQIVEYRAATKGHGVLGFNLKGAWYTSKELNADTLLRFARDRSAIVYLNEDARSGWLVPTAFPHARYLVTITGRWAAMPHTLQWRGFTEGLRGARVSSSKARLPNLPIGLLRALSLASKDNEALVNLASGAIAFMERYERGQVTEVDVTPAELEDALAYSEALEPELVEETASPAAPPPRPTSTTQSRPPSGGKDTLGIKKP